MPSRYRSYKSHLYIDMITGNLSTPGKGNLSYSKDKDKQSVGHYFSYGSTCSELDENAMCWIVTRGKQEVDKFFMSRDQIIERYRRQGISKANEVEQRLNLITTKLQGTAA